MRKMVLAITALIIAVAPLAASAIGTRLIKNEELTGAWTVVAFFPGSFGEKYPDSSYLSASQIYGFYEDGHVRSLVSDSAKLYEQSLTELEMHFKNKPVKINYHFVAEGAVAVTIDPEKKQGVIWATHIITEAGKFKGVNVLEGDIIMGMTPTKESKKSAHRYIRIMRKSN